MLPLLLLLLLFQDVAVSDAQAAKPSASCNPWSANFRGEVRIASQAEADEYTCFRRIIGSLTVVQSTATPIVMPKLRGVIGDLRIVFATLPDRTERDPAHVLERLMPMLESVSGHVMLEYHGDALLSGMRAPREPMSGT